MQKIYSAVINKYTRWKKRICKPTCRQRSLVVKNSRRGRLQQGQDETPTVAHPARRARVDGVDGTTLFGGHGAALRLRLARGLVRDSVDRRRSRVTT